MNSKEYREFLEAYRSVYEQQIGVPLKDASDRAAKQQLQKMIPKGEKVYTPKTTLQKAHYEPDGDLVDEGLLGSLDNVVRNTAGSIGGTIGKNKGQQTGIPGGGAVGEILGRNKGTSTYDKVTQPVRNLKLPGFNKGGVVKNLSNSYEPDDELTEDIEERRKQLAQKRREQIAGFRERISGRVKANAKRRKEREEHSREQITASRESDIENRRKRRESAAENRRIRRQSSVENRRNREEREQLKSEIKSELAREAVGDPINPNSVFKLSDPEVQSNLKSAAKPSGPAPMKPKVEKKPQQPAADRFIKRMVGSTMLSPL